MFTHTVKSPNSTRSRYSYPEPANFYKICYCNVLSLSGFSMEMQPSLGGSNNSTWLFVFCKTTSSDFWSILYDTYAKKLQEYWLVISIALQPGLCLKLDVKQKKPIAFGLNSYWDTRWKAVSRASFSVDAPCLLTYPVCWHALYVDAPCMLTRPVRWRALYVDATCMLTRPVCWRALYVDATCMLTQPVCWRTLYVDTPCMLTSPVCWRTL